VSGRVVMGLVAASWLASALAAKNADIERGNERYEAGEYDEAMAAYDAAEEELGERPELHYNRGLVHFARDEGEEARKAFEHGTESEELSVRASAEYELGNLEFDAGAWDAAIARYINCLKADPEHEAAKWNLELALQRKQQEQEEQEEQQDEEQQDEEQQDEESQDEEQEENQDEEEQQDEGQDEEQQDEEQQQEEQQDEGEQEQEQPQDEQQEQPGEQQPQPQPVDRADLDKALEQLDEEDPFGAGRPAPVLVPVEKDW